MADSLTNFATAAGVMVGLGVLLFVVRARRPKEAKTFGGEDREKKSSMILAASPFQINVRMPF